MSALRILFLSQVFPDDGAPVRGTFNLALCEALSVEHKVRVIAPRPWTEALPRWVRRRPPVSSGALLDQTTLHAEYPTFWHVPRIAPHRMAKPMLRAARRALGRFVEEFRPDAVLSYWAHPEGRVGIELGRALGVPSACIIGGSDVLLLPHKSRRRRNEVARVLSESDAIITVSDGLRHACVQLGAIPGRVRTIYQGIDRSTFFPRDRLAARRRLHIPSGVAAFLWVGRIIRLKRLDVTLDAIARLHHAGQRVKLYILGDGPDRDRIREYAEALGLVSVVDFVGTVAPADLPEWYSAADATVLSSDSEGLPNVLRESMACGTPFVATEVGSIGEFALPDCSRLAPVGDSAALAAALQEILRPAYRIAAGLHRPRTWSDCAREIVDLLGTMSRSRAAQRMQAAAGAEPLRPQRGSIKAGATAPVAAAALAGDGGRADAVAAGNPEQPCDVMDLLNRRLHVVPLTDPGGDA